MPAISCTVYHCQTFFTCWWTPVTVSEQYPENRYSALYEVMSFLPEQTAHSCDDAELFDHVPGASHYIRRGCR